MKFLKYCYKIDWFIFVFSLSIHVMPLVANIALDLSSLAQHLTSLHHALSAASAPAVQAIDNAAPEVRAEGKFGTIIKYDKNIQQAITEGKPLNLLIAADLPATVKKRDAADSSHPPRVIIEDFKETLGIATATIKQLIEQANPSLIIDAQKPKYIPTIIFENQQPEAIATILRIFETTISDFSENYIKGFKLLSRFSNNGPVDALNLSVLEIDNKNINFIVGPGNGLNGLRSVLLAKLAQEFPDIKKLNPDEHIFRLPLLYASEKITVIPQVKIHIYTTQGWRQTLVPITNFVKWSGSAVEEKFHIDRQFNFNSPAMTLYWLTINEEKPLMRCELPTIKYEDYQ